VRAALILFRDEGAVDGEEAPPGMNRIGPGLQVGGIIEGAVVTETVFTWPGVGRLAVESIFNKDYTVVQGIVLLAAFSFMFANLVVDLVYGWLDPRISYA